jgi:hypothetical protein
MIEKVSCTCPFCLEKNLKDHLLSKRTKIKYKQKYNFQPEENRMLTQKQRMITLKERRSKK